MIKKYNKEIGFIHKNENNIDKIYKNSQLVFEQGFTREDNGSTPLTTSHQAIGKNLKNYKVYGKSRQSNLPEGYTEIEYIRGNDSGYVPTNIYLNGDDIVKIKFKTLSSNIAFCLFGSYKANESDNFSVYIQSTYDSYFRYGDINYRQLKASPNTIYEIEMCADYLKINEETYYPFTTQTFTTRYPIYIGHINSSSSSKLKGIIYSFEIVGKAKLLSCTRNSDGQIGMYDVMNNTFYPASGTLTAGADVVPTPSEPIEIESVGDKSKNLFDEKNMSETGTYTNVVITNNNGNLTFNGTSNGYGTFYMWEGILKAGTYTVSSNNYGGTSTSNDYVVLWIGTTKGGRDIQQLLYYHPIEFTLNEITYVYLCFKVYVNSVYNNLKIENIQIEKGSTPTSYEPYYEGYKIPIIVSDGTNSSTTNIYLDEPLRKVGDYADYIDYKEQKVYRNVIVNDDSGEQTIENSYSGTTDTTGTSVTLPTIPSLVGTTIYDVDTKVKPSNMYIKYKGK